MRAVRISVGSLQPKLLSRGGTSRNCGTNDRNEAPVAVKPSPKGQIKLATCGSVFSALSLAVGQSFVVGAMVQRLARGPFKAEIRVRFPLALPISHTLTGVLLTLAHTFWSSESRGARLTSRYPLCIGRFPRLREDRGRRTGFGGPGDREPRRACPRIRELARDSRDGRARDWTPTSRPRRGFFLCGAVEGSYG
jgi:hypothetical protein